MILKGKMNMKEVSIITGASGTLGKSVIEDLLKRNHTVLAISRHSLNKKIRIIMNWILIYLI